MSVLSQLLETKVVAIVRGADPTDVLKIASALHDGGVMAMEITLNSPSALDVIEELAAKMGDKMLIGAGTVLDPVNAKAAIDAGARFIISPITDADIIRTTRHYEAVSIPGAFTPTEIAFAYAHGGDIIKVFPASGNINYIKEVRAPLPHIPLMPTGGINLENIKAFLQAGAIAFGIGTALVDTSKPVTDEYLQRITENAAKFMQAIKS